MTKRIKQKSVSAAPQDEINVAGLINKMQQQLNAIEKKLDILISQPATRPFEKNYSQGPPRSFDRPHRHDRGRQGSGGPRERTYNRVICADCNKECEIPFRPSGDRPVYCRECFSKRKSGGPFNANRDNRPEKRNFSRESHSDKRQNPFKNKKPFFPGRKKRA